MNPKRHNAQVVAQLIDASAPEWYCIDEVQTIHAQQVLISVDIHNPRAQKLYESLGFRVVETKTIALLGSSIGSRILSLSLS
jgi:ribosomal protein S18 acetylase RimI-like enzyme